jgi:hypothetical protein
MVSHWPAERYPASCSTAPKPIVTNVVVMGRWYLTWSMARAVDHCRLSTIGIATPDERSSNFPNGKTLHRKTRCSTASSTRSAHHRRRRSRQSGSCRCRRRRSGVRCPASPLAARASRGSMTGARHSSGPRKNGTNSPAASPMVARCLPAGIGKP